MVYPGIYSTVCGREFSNIQTMKILFESMQLETQQLNCAPPHKTHTICLPRARYRMVDGGYMQCSPKDVQYDVRCTVGRKMYSTA